MKKLSLLFALLVLTSSCTIEDVMNYLQGSPSNLTDEEKEQVDREFNTYNSQQLTNDPADIDPDKIKPPTHG